MHPSSAVEKYLAGAASRSMLLIVRLRLWAVERTANIAPTRRRNLSVPDTTAP